MLVCFFFMLMKMPYNSFFDFFRRRIARIESGGPIFFIYQNVNIFVAIAQMEMSDFFFVFLVFFFMAVCADTMVIESQVGGRAGSRVFRLKCVPYAGYIPIVIFYRLKIQVFILRRYNPGGCLERNDIVLDGERIVI